jgi:tryptophan-rich sensory protein
VIRPAVFAGVLIVAGVVLEGALAGSGVRARLAELHRPSFSPPFPVWVAIGILYYAVCFGVAYRLASNRLVGAARTLGLSLLAALVIANALWNYAFFRRRDLRLTWHISIGYAALAVALAIWLFVTDSSAALWFLPYLLYLPYATWWTRAVRMLNTPDGSEARQG